MNPPRHRSPASVASSGSRWPFIARYRGPALAHVACPLGGIGTGTVSLGGRGDLRDWEVMNRPAKGFVPVAQSVGPFLALRARPVGGSPAFRLLEGRVTPSEIPPLKSLAGPCFPGLPRFAAAEFLAAYPLCQVRLSDLDFPLAATLQAYNPLVPGDPDASGLPLISLRIQLRNRTARSVETSLCFTLPNFIGNDGRNGTAPPPADVGPGGDPIPAESIRHSITAVSTRGLLGLRYERTGGDPRSEAQGTLALAVADLPASAVSRRTAWAEGFWGWSVQDFLDDFISTGRVSPRSAGTPGPTAGTLCATFRLPPRGTRSVTFLLAWHFPNRRGWSRLPGETVPGALVGNHYATRFSDAWDVLQRCHPKLPALERSTVSFVSSIVASDLPAVLRESALSNLVPLRSQTCFRAADGRFYGWEGCGDNHGNFFGTCTHVWLYDGATHRLFGALARSMRETELLDCTRDDGLMVMRCPLPRAAPAWIATAADGHCGVLLRLLREFRATGDRAWLARLWPRARAALRFCWIPSGWDADRDGLMEGPQHNTMDVEYCGPNPQVASWYLAALRAGEELARIMGEPALAAECGRLFRSGVVRLGRLFNGAFYPQEIIPLARGVKPPPGLSNLVPDGNDLADPCFQLGPACSIDQLAALPYAREARLGDLVPPARARAVLRGILRYNRRRSLRHHLNPRRPMAFGEDAGVVLATWPRGGRPTRPFPYAEECWSGCEHLLAAALLWVGLEEEGLRVIADVRARHAGHNRNPFNEFEAGSHYARTLSAWAPVTAYTRNTYDAPAACMSFANRPGRYPWAAGDAWGDYLLTPLGRLTLRVRGGARPLLVRQVEVGGACRVLPRSRRLTVGAPPLCVRIHS